MQELVTKFKELIEYTEGLAKELQAKTNAVNEDKAAVEREKAAVKLAQDALAERELAVKQVESLVAIDAASKARLAKANEQKIENEKASEALAEREEALEEREAELKSLIEVYKTKSINVDAMKVKLEEDRKNMRIQIIEELKNLK